MSSAARHRACGSAPTTGPAAQPPASPSTPPRHLAGPHLAGYAAADSDAQHDRWLYAKTLRGTEPATAAADWTERRTLTRQRALAARTHAGQPAAASPYPAMYPCRHCQR